MYLPGESGRPFRSLDRRVPKHGQSLGRSPLIKMLMIVAVCKGNLTNRLSENSLHLQRIAGSAAGETFSIWPGQPMAAHWDIEDTVASVALRPERGDMPYEAVYTSKP